MGRGADVRCGAARQAGRARPTFATTGLRSYGLSLQVPLATLVTFVLVAMLVGILAAIVPARRAGKLNVLAALQYE